MQKFWTIRNGKIGTAHLNRRGEEVDFQEAAVTHFERVDEEIVLTPAKGVDCEPLRLRASSSVRTTEVRGDSVMTQTFWSATFEVTHQRYVQTHGFGQLTVERDESAMVELWDEVVSLTEEARQKTDAEFRLRMERRQAAKDRLHQQARTAFSAEEIFPLLTRSEKGRILSSHRWKLAIRGVCHRLWTRIQEAEPDGDFPFRLAFAHTEVSLVKLRQTLVEKIEREADFKRQQWWHHQHPAEGEE